MTIFTGAKSLPNSRPLTYQTSNPEDETPLTPNHFLHGQVGDQFAPSTVDETQFNLCDGEDGEECKNQYDTFGRDVSENGCHTLVKEQSMSPETPRRKWPFGKITHTYHGEDGHVRTVKVLIKGKEYQRPITRLCPLQIIESDNQENGPQFHFEGGGC